MKDNMRRIFLLTVIMTGMLSAALAGSIPATYSSNPTPYPNPALSQPVYDRLCKDGKTHITVYNLIDAAPSAKPAKGFILKRGDEVIGYSTE